MNWFRSLLVGSAGFLGGASGTSLHGQEAGVPRATLGDVSVVNQAPETGTTVIAPSEGVVEGAAPIEMAPAASYAGGFSGTDFDWKKVPPVRVIPRPGFFPMLPT